MFLEDKITPARRLQSVFSHVATGVRDQFTNTNYHRVHVNSNKKIIKIIDPIYGYEYTITVEMTRVPSSTNV